MKSLSVTLQQQTESMIEARISEREIRKRRAPDKAPYTLSWT